MAGTKLQRQVSPIPPGRYWIVVDNPGNIADFDAWIRDMAGAVRVESATMLKGPAQFVLFNVPAGRAPFLNAEQFGFPNFAGPEIRSYADAVSNRPDLPLEPLDLLEQKASAFGSDLKFIGLALLIVLALSISLKH